MQEKDDIEESFYIQKPSNITLEKTEWKPGGFLFPTYTTELVWDIQRKYTKHSVGGKRPVTFRNQNCLGITEQVLSK